MKLAIRSFVAALVLMSTWGHSGPAWAKGQKVFVERFSGPGTAPFRRMVLEALEDQGAWVVPEAQRSTAEVVLTGTLSRYRAAFIAVLAARDAGGEEIGRPGVWLGRTVPGTLVVARRNVERKVAAVLAHVPSTDERTVAKAAVPSTDERTVAKAAKVPARAATSDPNDEVDKILDEALERVEEQREPARTEEDEERPARPARRVRTYEDEPSLSAADEAADEADEPTRPKDHMFDLWVGSHFYGRSFKYNQNFSGEETYEAPIVPSPALSLDYFFTPHVGVTVGGEYAVGVSSQQASGGGALDTKAFGYFLGTLFRYLPSARTELVAGLAYAVNRFEVTSDRAGPMALRLPGVEYEQARVGGSIRFAMFRNVSLLGGASYLHLLALGELARAYFPRATGHGGEGHGGVAIRLGARSALEARVMVDLRRYVFAMNSVPGDEHVVGGAVDQYLGLNVGLGYRP
jgi:hypothetical protein